MQRASQFYGCSRATRVCAGVTASAPHRTRPERTPLGAGHLAKATYCPELEIRSICFGRNVKNRKALFVIEPQTQDTSIPSRK